ncbi:hypothetical protein V2A60_005026 [Cordyceps javanica]
MPSTAHDPRDSSVRPRDRERDRRRRDTRDRERERSGSEDEDTEDESTADEREKEKDRERERDRDRDRDRDRVRQRRHRDSYMSRDSVPPPPPPASPPSRRISLTERLKGTFLRRGSVANADGGPPSPSLRRGFSNAGGSSGGGAPGSSSSSSSKGSPIPRIREWLDTCNNQHGRHCSGGDEGEVSTAAGTFRPHFLIDAADKRLVRAKPDDRYVALSYVWGPAPQRPDAPPAQLVKSNLDEWLAALPEHNVPQTIADAIWLARKLGLRHIWIDRMCIVQDDDAAKEHHIRNMAYVFSNAYLTIVAAHNDVNTGLLPLNTRRPSRPPRVGGAPDHNELLLASRWNTRGWTLQELLYSRRAVFFFEDAVTWECHCDLWQGPGTGGGAAGFARGMWKGKKPECTHRISAAAFGFQHAPWPDMDEYARVAADYSARRVTQVDDTLRAFAGITTVLARVFPGGFVFGMPLMFLDSALLWRPQASIRRRALSRPPFLPSWSWMGWWFDGIRVDLTLWKASADYVEDTRTSGKRGQHQTAAGAQRRFQAPSSFRLRPTVVWRLSDRATSAPVTNNGFQFRELRSRRHAPTAGLPPGWSRSGAHFVHDSDDDTVFKYPVPVEDPPLEGEEEQPPPPGELAFPGPLLAFRTTSGIFDVDFAVTLAPKDAAQHPPVAVGNIWGRGRRWVGEFRAHDGWLGIQSSNYDGDEKLEFIAISSAVERWGSLVFPPDRYEEHADAKGWLEVVNVLWIERIAGVAYRRGIGHVLQKAWDAHAVEEMDILLG